jgi:hypothetical protein
MSIKGYILIEGDIWRVSMRGLNTRRSLKRRRKGKPGEHLPDVEAFLTDWDNRWLLDHLRYGDKIYLPLETPNDPPLPAAHGV